MSSSTVPEPWKACLETVGSRRISTATGIAHAETYRRRVRLAPLTTLLTVLLLGLPSMLNAQQRQRVFNSPGEAANALFAAVKADDTAALSSILGPNSQELISSGDPVADKNALAEFSNEWDQMHRLAYDDQGRVIIYLGSDNWPAPIPIVKKGSGWVFDAAAGKDELIYRRIGRNELYTIAILENLSGAQQDYASHPHDGVQQYARYIMSDPGKQNGLYWETSQGQPPSPIGPLIADATTQGYKVQKREEPRTAAPFHGYFYRVLTRQGKNAPGGAKNYIVNGKMTDGFAFLAWPAEYRSSGVMTFMINQDSVLVQKDLGPDTAKIVEEISSFNPDSMWEQVERDSPPG
jgi:hypothetical protein